MQREKYSRGVSFMIRARNEESILNQSILSLVEHLTVPFEVVVVLHLCTDKSEEIVQNLIEKFGNNKIKLFLYNQEISKCGYENLCTDATSQHSVVSYYNWCLSKLQYQWVFKWDADFIASKELVNFLNYSQFWCNSNKNMRYKINAENSTSKNREFYLSNCIICYRKYIFWELAEYAHDSIPMELSDEVNIRHASELDECKTYWHRVPWYLAEDTNEAHEVREKVVKLQKDYGLEPIGMARASNPECDSKYLQIKNINPPTYVNFFN
jgi:glycosyltransferase involved in cell wall biosynthesis